MLAVTVATLTDLGFLWFREFYLESSRVIQVILITSRLFEFQNLYCHQKLSYIGAVTNFLATCNILHSNLSLLVAIDSNHQMMIG